MINIPGTAGVQNCEAAASLIVQRVRDPDLAERFAREYCELEEEFLRARQQLGIAYNLKLADLWQRIATAS